MLKLTNINYGEQTYDPGKANYTARIQSGGCALSIARIASISQLCIPFTLNEHELDQLDNIIERKKLHSERANSV